MDMLLAMTLDRRKFSVGLFLVLAVLASTLGSVAYARKCYCAEYINTIKDFVETCPDESCETFGVCATDVKRDGVHIIVRYDCIEDTYDGVSSIAISCSINDSQQVVQCCNDTDNCNRDILPTLLPTLPPPEPQSESTMAPPPTPTPTTTVIPSSLSDNKSPPNIAVTAGIAAAVVVTFISVGTIVLGVLMYHLRRRKLKGEQIRRVPKGMMEARPTGEMELMDMTVTSGSGSGLPFLIQRTVARTIKITELIGNGRYGQVYLGYYQGEPVAVKKFFSRDEKSWCRETEIYNTLLLRHDNILGFFASDMVSNNGVTELWLITQYHQFGSLYDFLAQEAVSPKVLLQMSISTCSGLAHLHTELFGTQAKPAISHRDMKTKNVLVKNNMTCCIADFGLAVFKNQSGMNIPTNPKQGTKRYMAPEILNETVNVKSFESFKQVDVYALGLILWELCRRCTGNSGVPEECEIPFQGMVPPDPSFEDMRKVVVVERRQPVIPPRWNTEELLREMTKVMRECWYYTSTARPTAVYLKKKLLRMSQELEKMNYGDLDVQQAT